MSNLHFYILITMYAIFGIVAFIFELKNIKNNKKIDIIDFFRVFYLIIYCIVPICSLIVISNNRATKIKSFQYLETDSILFKYIACIMAIVLYIGINKFYSIFSRKKVKSRAPIIDNNSTSFYIGNLVIMIVGWVSLFLYTYAYGSVFGILEYASLIRDNIFKVENKLTFFEPFTAVLIFSTLNYIVLLRNLKGKPKSYKILTVVLSVISFCGSFLVLLINDSRMQTIFQILIIGYFFIGTFKIDITKFSFKKLAIGLVAVFLFMFIVINMNSITFIMKGIKPKNDNKYDIVEFIAKEFGHTYVNNINVLERLVNKKNLDIRIDDNIACAIVTFMPRRIQREIATNMYVYNTSFVNIQTGKIPTDLISGAIYSLHYLGIFAFMIWIPFLLTKIQDIFNKYERLNDYYIMLFSYLGIFVVFRVVAYYDFSQLLFSCFALIVSYIILVFFNIATNKKIILYAMNKGFFNFLSDEKYLKLKFRLIMGKKLDLKNPKTFNKKLQWLKLYNRKPEYTIMADKYAVKEYVGKKIGDEYIIPTLGVYNNFTEIDFNMLPNEFVLKPNHTSGDVFICNNKQDIDYIKLKEEIKKWLKRNYYLLHREWPYKNIKPKIIAEKYMVDESGEDLKDYKFFCFNGKVGTILVCSNRKGTFKNTDFYDTKWEKMPFTREKHSNNPEEISRPKNLEKMVEIAEKLSKDIPFVRIDLYEINGNVYFGEFTFYPSAGFEGFKPKIWDYKLGSLMDISNK